QDRDEDTAAREAGGRDAVDDRAVSVPALVPKTRDEEANDGARALKGFKTMFTLRLRWYSWMSPPSRSWRSTVPTLGRSIAVADSGGCSASARWGRSRL